MHYISLLDRPILNIFIMAHRLSVCVGGDFLMISVELNKIFTYYVQ